MRVDRFSEPAFFRGSSLRNHRVKQVLIDEAGINAGDPVVVIAGVVIDPDLQFAQVERRIADAINSEIPEHMRDSFVFHAKDVFGKYRRREGWSWNDCNRITDAWLQIATDLKLPVILTWIAKSLNEKGTCDANDRTHMIAFAECLQGVDDYMRAYADDEVASIIAEDCPQMRSRLRHIAIKLAKGELIGQLNFDNEITNIKGGVLFAQKTDSPILQISDAFAFAFSRYANNRRGGSRFWAKMNGSPKMMAHLDIPNSGGGRLLLWPK